MDNVGFFHNSSLILHWRMLTRVGCWLPRNVLASESFLIWNDTFICYVVINVDIFIKHEIGSRAWQIGLDIQVDQLLKMKAKHLYRKMKNLNAKM